MRENRTTVTSAAVAALITGTVSAATTGWNTDSPGTYSYTNAANWVGGTVNDTFDSSLALLDDTTTGNQLLTFSADYSTAGAMTFAYDDAAASSIPYNFSLQADGSADRTLTLGGDFAFTPAHSTRLLTIGSTTSGEGLNVNLGGVARTFNIVSDSYTGKDHGYGVTINNAISNGSITKTGSGWLRLGGTEANTISSLTISGGTVRLQKSNGVNAVDGDILVNGGTLLIANGNQIPDSASITLTSGAVYMAPTSGSSSSGGSNDPQPSVAETIFNLTISGGTLNSGPKSTSGGGFNAAQVVSGVMNVSGGSVSIKNRNTFTANKLVISGSSGTTGVSVSSSSGTTTLVIGSDGLWITNLTTGAFNAISVGGNGALKLSGDVNFDGYAGNTETARINASATSRTLSLDGGIRTFTINDGDADVDLIVDADFTITDGAGTGGITKEGLGTLQINSSGTYTGPTTVNAGKLLINGSIASAAIVNGGTLGGNGTITGGITVNAGTLAPGNSIDVLNAGTTVFGDGSNFAVELDALGVSDLLVVTGDIDLSSLLDTLTLTGSADGSDYTIATYTGSLTGTFDNVVGLPGGYHIDYGTGNNSAIILTTAAVPEPASIALLGLAGLCLINRRRV